MSKKGVSFEGKRSRILEIFHEEDDVFQLKQIEKLASKKGVTIQSVKDIVQGLVDDDLVHQDKIGISNFLWAFAGEASTKLQNDIKTLERQKQQLQGQMTQVDVKLQEEQKRMPDITHTKELLGIIADKERHVAALREELAAYVDVDPERVEVLKEAAVVARDSANRWLDNTHALKDWCQKQFNGREKDVEMFFAENGLTDKIQHIQ